MANRRYNAIFCAVLAFSGPAGADCGNHLIPPPEFDHAPTTDGSITFEPREDVMRNCAGITRVAEPHVGCEWFDSLGFHALLSDDVSPQDVACEMRHAFGHINAHAMSGDANPKHEGWTWGSARTGQP